MCTFVAAEHVLPYPDWPICTALAAVMQKGELQIQICPRSPRHRREGQRLSARSTMFHQADNLSQGSSIDTDSKATAGVARQNVGLQTAAGRNHASSQALAQSHTQVYTDHFEGEVRTFRWTRSSYNEATAGPGSPSRHGHHDREGYASTQEERRNR